MNTNATEKDLQIITSAAVILGGLGPEFRDAFKMLYSCLDHITGIYPDPEEMGDYNLPIIGQHHALSD